MLIEIAGAEPHEEDGWIGGRAAIGTAEVRITKADARCAITTQDPDTGVSDLDTLRSIIAYRGLNAKRQALFGVLGEVTVPGRIALGDEVRVAASAEAGGVAEGARVVTASDGVTVSRG